MLKPLVQTSGFLSQNGVFSGSTELIHEQNSLRRRGNPMQLGNFFSQNGVAQDHEIILPWSQIEESNRF